METIIDFYKELNLDSSLKAEEIMKQLVKQESVWHQREITSPEKARKKLVLIDKAKIVFSNATEKDKYDKELQMHSIKNEENEGKDNIAFFDKWYQTAKNYYDNEQYDLAKMAMEKAMPFYEEKTENYKFVVFCFAVYYQNKAYEQALNQINNAILLQPENPLSYLNKACLFETQEKNQDAYDNYLLSIKMAKNNQDSEFEGTVHGYLAHFLFNNALYSNALTSAKEAIKLSDPSGLGTETMELLNKPQQISCYDERAYSNEPCELMDDILYLCEKLKHKCHGEYIGWKIGEKKDICYYESGEYSGQVTLRLFDLVFDANKGLVMYTGENGGSNRYTFDYSVNHWEEKLHASNNQGDMNRFLAEFDYSCNFTQNIKDGTETSTYVGYCWDRPLTRIHCIKGQGLYKALKKIEDENIPPVSLVVYDEEMKRKIEKQKREQTVLNWKKQGKCQYCGGELKGLFGKKCLKCGKPKDY